MPARFATLGEWLAWQQTLSPRTIELGLERVIFVAERLGLQKPACPVITVAGTNGKGSVVAMLESILTAAGYRTGTYTSPHLLAYNERIRIAGHAVEDAPLMEAFAAIDEARADRALTYFEFGTLAALYIFRQASVDALVLEVGLGGRLDAVNCVDPDVAVITSIDIDHSEWLGNDREAVGFEKAGIMRTGRVAVCGDYSPPGSVVRHAAAIGADLRCIGRDFFSERKINTFIWSQGGRRIELPKPSLAGDHQTDNASTALAALTALETHLPVHESTLAAGLRSVELPGRYQRLSTSPSIILDVAHNPQAAHALAATLQAQPFPGKTLAVFSALEDKDIHAMLAPMRKVVDQWFIGGLGAHRGLKAEALAERLEIAGIKASKYKRVIHAVKAAREHARPDDRIIVFGSFLTVAEAMESGL